jgi:hypothetical protein
MSPNPSPHPAPNPQSEANEEFVPGNPFARHVAKLRAALVNSVSEADIQQVADDLRIQSKLGNMKALKLLFLYVLGKPPQPVNPDTLDIEEWKQVFQPIPKIMKEMPEAMMSLPVETASRMVQATQPHMEKAVVEVLSLPQEQFSELAREATERANACQAVPRSPSPNGSRVCKTRPASPSPNGGSSSPKPLPLWLMKIAEKARIVSSRVGNDPQQGP